MGDQIQTSQQGREILSAPDQNDAKGTVVISQPAAPTNATKAVPRRNWRGLGSIVAFFCLVAALAYGLDWIIGNGLRRIKTSQFGVSNGIVNGTINARVIISGSSRALSHYDSRIIQENTGRTTFNLGRNGSQTDMELAVLKTYLKHNRKPEIVLHNLDAYSFMMTKEAYDPGQYMPYLHEPDIYAALHRIDAGLWWKSRNLPLYGYVVEDMRFTWIQGVKGFFGWSPREDFHLGFNPRRGQWTEDFAHFKENHAGGVSFTIEPEGEKTVAELIELCQQSGIRLILVYSPEFLEMQRLTKNRTQVFTRFTELSQRYGVSFWDYSDWRDCNRVDYFRNSQHLNEQGAEAFSLDLARRLANDLPAMDVQTAQSGSTPQTKDLSPSPVP